MDRGREICDRAGTGVPSLAKEGIKVAEELVDPGEASLQKGGTRHPFYVRKTAYAFNCTGKKGEDLGKVH